MAKAGFRLHQASTPKQSARHADAAIYVQDGELYFERTSPDRISIVTQTARDSATGRANCTTANLTIADACRCRRALGLVIRQARKSAAVS